MLRFCLFALRNVALCSSIKSIEANPRIQSVILASSNPRIFSAGLDLAELVAPDADRLPRFWNSLQQVFVDLYGSRLATVAAIGGHAPAAGCFLALACDHRIMSAGDTGEGAPPPPAIGFNETRLGIAAPPWMGKMLVRTIGWRRAELALALGTLFPPDEALGIGLVDAVVPPRTSTSADEADDDAWLDLLPSAIRGRASDPALLRKAYAQASIYAKIPHQARVASKLVTREEHIHDMIAKRENDTDHFCEFVTQEAVQRILKGYVESMKKKGKKK